MLLYYISTALEIIDVHCLSWLHKTLRSICCTINCQWLLFLLILQLGRVVTVRIRTFGFVVSDIYGLVWNRKSWGFGSFWRQFLTQVKLVWVLWLRRFLKLFFVCIFTLIRFLSIIERTFNRIFLWSNSTIHLIRKDIIGSGNFNNFSFWFIRFPSDRALFHYSMFIVGANFGGIILIWRRFI